MIDEYGREIDYIRISVTDRCNLRCVYCMPEEGVPSISHDEILRFDEITRICRVLAGKGFKKVKLTGGEPLVRKGILSLIKEIKAIDGIENVTVTTNGVLLEEMYGALADAGVDAVTVSLDTLDPEMYRRLTRRGELETVLRGLTLAMRENRIPLKINCVSVYGVREQELLKVAALARDNAVHVRFIEMMPIGMGREFTFVGEEEIRRMLEEAFGPAKTYGGVLGNGPARYWEFEGFKGKIGFISAVSHKFCSSCNRIRLTSDGFLKTCLQFDEGADLRRILREGGSDEALAAAIDEAVGRKPLGHNFGEKNTFSGRENRGMSQIGG